MTSHERSHAGCCPLRKLFGPVQATFTRAHETSSHDDLLLIAGAEDRDEDLLEETVTARPRRVTVLIEDAGREWAWDDSPAGLALRERLAQLLHSIERRTDARVIGLAGDREQLFGWHFDTVVGGRLPVAA